MIRFLTWGSVDEPCWREVRQLKKHIPAPIYHWLTDNGSLTQKLKQHCPGRFSVKLVGQHWVRPLLSEAHKLKIRQGRLALVRQVLLCCDDVPMVFARTVMPLPTITGRWRRLRSLGERPLGELLFTDPRFKRRDREVARLHRSHALYQIALQHMLAQHIDREKSEPIDNKPRDIWGRRSVYTFHEKSLLVNEIFLPKLI
ncbi:chorismate--pyruvate lyase family protein [Kaarinaea lacus]